MDRVLVAVGRLVRDDDGQDLLEYGLIAVLIAIACVFAITSLGQTINTVLWSPIAQNF
jgi:Flp pilus assembly pilin Flp